MGNIIFSLFCIVIFFILLDIILKNKLFVKKNNEFRKFLELDNIKLFFKLNLIEDTNVFSNGFYLSEQTAFDLDIDDVFLKIDKTSCKVGEQYLYFLLRKPFETKQRVIKFNELLERVTSDKNKIDEIRKQTKRLNTNEDYYIPNLLFRKDISKPTWYKYTVILQILVLLSIFFTVFNHFFILIAGVVFFINSLFHYKTKNRFFSFYEGLSRISTIHDVSKRISKILSIRDEKIIAAIENGKKIVSEVRIFSYNKYASNPVTQLAWVISELIKIISLNEVQRTYKLLSRLEGHKETLLDLFCFIGEIDTVISVFLYRNSLPFYSIPNFVEEKHVFKFQNIYHPLIEKCVNNNFNSEINNNVFITGSNMSGKTTFIRSIGINALLARSICTCLSSESELSFFNVYSAINIIDDLNAGNSYFFEELMQLKKLIDVSDASNANNLFLIDEVLKGTNIYDRKSIAKSILTYLSQNPRNIVFVTSHDIDLAEELEFSYSFYNFQEIFSTSEITFDYKIKEGISRQKNATRLLQVLNFPKEIINQVI